MVKVNVERTVKVVIYRIHSQYDGVYWTCIDLKLAPLFPFFLVRSPYNPCQVSALR